VLPGGVAILEALFDSLGIHLMSPSSGALREGLLYDLLGRIRHEDVRDQTIRRLSDRYHVDREQAGRVESTALLCLRQVAAAWKLDVTKGRQLLSWAARLHEIGLSLTFTGYQKHSAYLVAHSELPGFSVEDQQLLAALILGHRRKLSASTLAGIPADEREAAWRLCILLRLAVCLNRSRSPASPPRAKLRATPGSLEIALPRRWLAQHPLTEADLREEAERLAGSGFKLRVK
jgi:exopolyphosphatase/guanosine-5'-triphosphate,3'-diphosphate pyrophosphatase